RSHDAEANCRCHPSSSNHALVRICRYTIPRAMLCRGARFSIPRKAASMEFGVFHEFPRLPGQSEAEAFADGLALVDAAERSGLGVLWLAELHLNTTTVIASPLAVAAAIAGRTERLRIGTAVQVLPLSNPLRLAEEWATVDQISRGRLIFGCGRS